MKGKKKTPVNPTSGMPGGGGRPAKAADSIREGTNTAGKANYVGRRNRGSGSMKGKRGG